MGSKVNLIRAKSSQRFACGDVTCWIVALVGCPALGQPKKRDNVEHLAPDYELLAAKIAG